MCNICCASQCHAQPFSTKQLTGTRWRYVVPEEAGISMWRFTKGEIETTTYYFPDRPNRSVRKYYLSKTIPTAFDFKKVGKNTKGKYLVYYIDKTGLMYYEEIVEMTPDSLKLFHKSTPGSIGGGDCYILFKRMTWKNQ